MVKYSTLFDRYQDSTVLQKSEQYAKWTLPALMAGMNSKNSNELERLERDYQDIGALLVNNLSTKLTALLFPTRPFFKIKASPRILASGKERGVKEADIAAGLAKMEVASAQQLYLNASYAQLILALKHLIVTGNVLLYRDSTTQSTTAYGLTRFGVRRDGRGKLIDCVLQESIDFTSLPVDVQARLRLQSPSKYRSEDIGKNRVRLYTRVQSGSGVIPGATYYDVTQQADDIAVGTPGKYPEHLCPWQVPTWSLIAGEDYGRGLVEDYAGGFAKLSDVSYAQVLYLVASSKFVNLVAPGMGADVDDLQRAETGEYVSGQEDAITSHESGDGRKMEQLRQEIETLFQRLARAFMYKANTRDAERVTAFELKQDALEAENTLGGAYSSLSASIQVGLAHLLLTEVSPGMLEGIISKDMKLDIMAGIQALGRSSDVQNLVGAAQEASAIIPVLAQLSNRVDKEKVLDVILAGQSVDPSTIMKDQETMGKEAEAASQEAAAQAQIQSSTTLADQASQLQSLGQ